MKYSVLTYIFGKYESVHEICHKDSNAEYILVTDNPELESYSWTVVYDERLSNPNMSPFDKVLYVRYHPFEYAHNDICLKIDGSIIIKDSLSPIISRFEELNADLALIINPVYNSLIEDYGEWIRTRNYPKVCADKAIAKLRELGIDEKYRGYYQANFILERNNELTGGVNYRTYNLLQDLLYDGHLDRFDQPVWSFILNKYYSKSVKVMPLNEWILTFSKYLQWCWHASNDAVPFKINMKPSYLFNELVECERFDYLSEKSNDMERMEFVKSKANMYKGKYNHYIALAKKISNKEDKINLVYKIQWRLIAVLERLLNHMGYTIVEKI